MEQNLELAGSIEATLEIVNLDTSNKEMKGCTYTNYDARQLDLLQHEVDRQESSDQRLPRALRN